MVTSIAKRQHGVVAYRQLIEKGVTPRQIDRLDWLERVHRGVYRVAGSPASRESRWLAAVLAVGDDATLFGPSAAALLGLVDGDPVAVHVACPRKVRARRGIVIHRVGLTASEQGWMSGIPCTEPNRTIFDLAQHVSPRELERALDELAMRRRLSVDLLHRYARRGGRGCRRLRAAVAHHLPGTTVTRSVLEERFLSLLDDDGLPRPRMNVPWRLSNGRRIVIDALFDDSALAVELDGRDTHTRGTDFQRDRERDRQLLIQGLRPVRFTFADLTAGRRDTLRELAQLLREER